jgi:hypothetical protein
MPLALTYINAADMRSPYSLHIFWAAMQQRTARTIHAAKLHITVAYDVLASLASSRLIFCPVGPWFSALGLPS